MVRALIIDRSALVQREECVALTVEGDGVYALRLRNGDSAPVSEKYVDEVRRCLVRNPETA